jgi:hypothetical protein
MGVLYGAATSLSSASSSSLSVTWWTRSSFCGGTVADGAWTAGPWAVGLARLSAMDEVSGVPGEDAAGGCFPVSSVGAGWREAKTIPATTSTAAAATRIPAGLRGT